MSAYSSNHSGCFKGFYQLSKLRKSGTRDDASDEIIIGFYHPEGGTSGEFSVVWTKVGGKYAPLLRVYDDAWHALSSMPELIVAMADSSDKNITPDAFAKMLIDLGFKDRV